MIDGGARRGRARSLVVTLAVALVAPLIAVLPSASPAVAEDEISTRGTEFWIAFPQQLELPTPDIQAFRIFVAAEDAATGTVSVPGSSIASQSFSVAAGGLTVVDLPIDVRVTEVDGIEQLGIRITADAPVTVYGLSLESFSSDAFVAFPTSALGTEYRVLHAPVYWEDPGGLPSGFSVIATRDGTTITVTPSIDARSRTAGVPYTVQLNTGQVYQLHSNAVRGDDLSGTLITSDAPVSVLGHGRCPHIPIGVFACDHVIQQLPSVDSWGLNFAVQLLEPRTRYTLRVMAARDGTEVTIDGTVVATLAAGEFHESIETTDVLVSTSRPALVAQYAHGIRDEGPQPEVRPEQTGDPFMMLIPPVEQFLDAYTVATAGTHFSAHFANVVTTTTGRTGITLNGTAIGSTDFTEIGGAGSGVWGATVSIPDGTHRFEGAEQFGVFIYGWTLAESYGYPGGTAFRQGIGRITALSVSADRTSTDPGGLVCVTANMTGVGVDSDLAGIRVRWTVTGANPATEFIESDSDGVSVFCYTPTNPGSDVVTATAGRFSDTAPISVASPATLAVACEPEPAPVGVTVTCTVTGADADIDFLWSVSEGASPRGGAVTMDARGTGQFQFVVTRAGASLQVELVDWGVRTSVSTSGPVPSSVPAGEGPAVPAGLVALGLLAAAGAAMAGRRLVVTG